MRNQVNWTCASDNMYLIVLIGFITLNCGSHGILQSGNLPCDFLDSMNISDGALGSNRTIIYKDLEFPLDQYARINYTFINGVERISVAPYIRGCVCNRKPCIRLCCPFGSIQVKSRQCQPNEVAKSMKVFSEKNHNAYTAANVTNIEAVPQFTFIHDYPCKRLYLIKSDYIIQAVCIPSKQKIRGENSNLSFL